MRNVAAAGGRTAKAVTMVVAVALIGLTGCTSVGGGDPTPPPTADPSGPSASPSSDSSETPPESAPVATTTMLEDGQEIVVAIHPLVRSGELLTLTVDLSRADGEESVLANTLGGATPGAYRGLRGVRLVDLDADLVHEPAYDEDGYAIATTDGMSLLASGVLERRVQFTFGAPAADVTELDVFWPAAPYVTAVPIVEGPVPDVPDDDVRYGKPVEDLAGADTFALSSYSRDLEIPVDVVADVEHVEILLGSDVLFDVDSADLTDEADAALDSAAARILEREAGEILVVGHTDSVDSEEHNLELSEERAETVAAALGDRVGSSYTFATEGRGESEPIADNDTEDGRALNRRVELTLSTAEVTLTEAASTATMPDFDGPSGTAADGVDVEFGRGAARVRVLQARLVDGHPIIDLGMTAAPEDTDSMVVGATLSGIDSPRGSGYWTSQANLGAVRLVVDGRAFYPLDYNAWADEENELWLPLTDLESRHELGDAEQSVYSVVYPRVPAAQGIALERTGSSAVEGFRLTDVTFTG